jgi:hypothetical protein
LVFSVNEQHQVISRIGTFLAFAHEGNDAASRRWHRMNRKFDEWCKTRQKASRVWFRLSLWGRFAQIQAALFVLVTVANWYALVGPTAVRAANLRTAISPETLVAVLAVVTILFLLPPLFGYFKPDSLEAEWRCYHASFENSDVATKYQARVAGSIDNPARPSPPEASGQPPTPN